MINNQFGGTKDLTGLEARIICLTWSTAGPPPDIRDM